MAVSRGRGSALLLALGVFLLSSQCISAKEHTVGGSSGWNFNVNFTGWASNETFLVGDTLKFVFTNGSHTVIEVNSTEYTNCSYSGNPNTGSPVTYSLEKAKTYYYICTIPSHCVSGLKVKINVAENTQPASPPPPPSVQSSSSPPPPSNPSPPPPVSASSVAAIQLVAVLIAPILSLFVFIF